MRLHVKAWLEQNGGRAVGRGLGSPTRRGSGSRPGRPSGPRVRRRWWKRSGGMWGAGARVLVLKTWP